MLKDKNELKVYKILTKRHGMTCTIANKHTERKELLHYDEKTDESRALRYATNQKSIFEDEQKGVVKTAQIVFEDGVLKVERRKPTLIKFLEHHPDNRANGGTIFEEVDHAEENRIKEAAEELVYEAMTLARELSKEEQRAIARQVIPSRIDKMTEAEVFGWVKSYAKNNADTFMDMAGNFASLSREDIIKTALAQGIIKFKRKNTEVAWSYSSRNSMICRIPEGEDPHEALERYLMSNDGIETFEDIEGILKD